MNAKVNSKDKSIDILFTHFPTAGLRWVFDHLWVITMASVSIYTPFDGSVVMILATIRL
jgi:hypothetical protein